MKILRLLWVGSLVLGICSWGLAQEAKRNAVIIDFKGAVEVKNPKGDWSGVKAGDILNEGDILRVKKNSWAVLNLDGQAQTATVEVKENSQLKLSEFLENKEESSQTTLLDLALGEILIKAKKLHSEKSKFEVKTPTSVVGVRGTTFSVSVEAVE